MHELLLFGQIPESRFTQLTEILAGLTALPEPRRLLERRYIFRPSSAPVQKVEQLGGSQNIADAHKAARNKQKTEAESRYCTLIEDLTLRDLVGADDAREEGGARRPDASDAATSLNAEVRPRFTLQVADVPEPEIKSVMSLAKTVTVIKEQDALAAVEAQGFRFVHQYVVEGRQFVFNHVVIRLQRCMDLVPLHAESQPGPRSPIDEFQTRTWDKSGGYILQASVTISDGKNPELVSRGTEELRRLKEDLRGCVELRTVERLCMDSRAR